MHELSGTPVTDDRQQQMARAAHWLWGVLALAAFALLAGCEGAAVATPPPVTITIAGSSSMGPVLRELSTAYARQHPNVLFDLRGGGSTIGEDAIRAGRVDIAASTRFPPDPASAQPTPAGDERLVRTPIGIDGLAVVVHPGNDIDALSLVQLRDLFSGRVLDWQALGGDAGEVVLVSREDGSGARILFEDRVMGDERVSLTAVIMPTSDDVVEYVSRNPAAIGYVSRAHVVDLISEEGGEPVVDDDAPVKVLSLEGRQPTRESVASQQYALTQPLYLITQGTATGHLRQFIDFVLSPAGQAIVAQFHAPIR